MLERFSVKARERVTHKLCTYTLHIHKISSSIHTDTDVAIETIASYHLARRGRQLALLRRLFLVLTPVWS